MTEVSRRRAKKGREQNERRQLRRSERSESYELGNMGLGEKNIYEVIYKCQTESALATFVFLLCVERSR